MFAPAASTVTGLIARNCMVHNTAEDADASKLVITPGQIRDQKRNDFSKGAYGLDTHLEVEEKPADTTCHAKIVVDRNPESWWRCKIARLDSSGEAGQSFSRAVVG